MPATNIHCTWPLASSSIAENTAHKVINIAATIAPFPGFGGSRLRRVFSVFLLNPGCFSLLERLRFAILTFLISLSLLSAVLARYFLSSVAISGILVAGVLVGTKVFSGSLPNSGASKVVYSYLVRIVHAG